MHRDHGYHAIMPKIKALRTVLGENVAAVMEAKGLRQQEVANLAKHKGMPIDQTTVGRVARAVFPATVDTVEAIAAAIGVQPWLLLIPEGVDKNLLAILKAWSVSSEPGRELLLFAAEAAIKRDDDRKAGGAKS